MLLTGLFSIYFCFISWNYCKYYDSDDEYEIEDKCWYEVRFFCKEVPDTCRIKVFSYGIKPDEVYD